MFLRPETSGFFLVRPAHDIFVDPVLNVPGLEQMFVEKNFFGSFLILLWPWYLL